jgi:choline dehydrogenase-like flavoprotein
VILCAGAYRSPQLLMLSGIGSPESLKKHNIPLQVELPAVGLNFHDHLSVSIWWKLRYPERGLAAGSAGFDSKSFAKGLPCDWIAWQRAEEGELRLALQKDGEHQNHPLLQPRRCHTETLVVYGPERAHMIGVDIPMDGSHITSPVLLLTPTSRGSIELASSNILDPPLIDPNYLSTSVDRCMIRSGMRQAFRLFQETAAGKSCVIKETAPEDFIQLNSSSPHADMDARAIRTAGTFYHGAGSASMGKVVDTKLKVLGIESLRVVDASVFPLPIAAHYQAIIHALAEKAADMILQAQRNSKI